MTGRIITVRHGKPALSRRVQISAQGFHDWWQQYDQSGLHTDARPPEKLKVIANNAVAVFASVMPRAIETGEMLTGDKISVQPDAIFVEAPLPTPPWYPWIRLSPRYWGVISRTYWEFGYAPDGMERRDQTWIRIDKIIDRLAQEASSGDVMLCAHGYLNWMISRRMKSRNWTCVDHRGGNKYWSWRAYERKV